MTRYVIKEIVIKVSTALFRKSAMTLLCWEHNVPAAQVQEKGSKSDVLGDSLDLLYLRHGFHLQIQP